MQNFCLSDAILERFKSVEQELGYSEHIVKLDCNTIDTWEYRERSSFELGCIDSLALSIKQAGQCQPIIVVRVSETFKPKDNPSAQYVVIAGYRRWMACKTHHLEVQAVIRNLSFEQAITVLIADYEKETVSDYSKGMLYHTLLTTAKITPDQLCHRLNISRQQLESYLAFAQVPAELWRAVGDMSKVSARTAVTIKTLSDKGTVYLDALFSIAKKIAQGFGEKRIIRAVETKINLQLKRRPPENLSDHQIEFNGKILMNLHQGRIKLDKSLVNHGNFKELVGTLEKNITDFANNYFKDNFKG
ncbi:ParB/RepB/Spo0J family partition protein [Legionella bononiensis]|uniref:ParB/RepB/Spo0J family partition protein n=1 Tax=Legionella bononiensis TaxID=2793102 RepID=A0ABS1WCQ5_9GAMM|nr:ParB/RepB/Spo0J family partition protein [Legionella bononiensis]MBL7479008.1 ParB/RepB/Spo0J family partition protein [Legionella bononiensis]MBL7527141.1 ParB/RepB/Spo0J family partition protein [Legionella bononiensis]MBL7562110.1 ParB/RepB/Spo0J family partition protein [Legionella bononiensis]